MIPSRDPAWRILGVWHAPTVDVDDEACAAEIVSPRRRAHLREEAPVQARRRRAAAYILNERGVGYRMPAPSDP